MLSAVMFGLGGGLAGLTFFLAIPMPFLALVGWRFPGLFLVDGLPRFRCVSIFFVVPITVLALTIIAGTIYILLM